MSKPLLLTLDDSVWEDLEKIRREGGFNTPTDVLIKALQVYKTLHNQARAGFDEVLVKNERLGGSELIVEIGRAPFKV